MTWQESVVQALNEGVSSESILNLAETKKPCANTAHLKRCILLTISQEIDTLPVY